MAQLYVFYFAATCSIAVNVAVGCPYCIYYKALEIND